MVRQAVNGGFAMTDRAILRSSAFFTLEEVTVRSQGSIAGVGYVVRDSRSAVHTTTHDTLAAAEQEFSKRVAAGH
jgi:hypothetical protein